MRSFFLLLFINALIYAQISSVAQVGKSKITQKEFKFFFESIPKIKYSYGPKDSVRINFLYSMITEKLWALKAKEEKGDTTFYFRSSIRDIKKKLLIDGLYQKEIEKRIKISPDEISKEKKKLHQKRILYFIFSKDRKEIYSLFASLIKGEKFLNILKSRKEFSEEKNGMPVVYADMKKSLEDKIFSLKKGEFTKPIKMNDGWVIYYLKSIKPIGVNPRYPNESDDKLVKDVIFSRKAKKLYSLFFKKYVKGKVIESDKKLFHKLNTFLFWELNKNKRKIFNKIKKRFELGYYSILKIRKNFSSRELKSSFVKFKKAPINLNVFLSDMAINGFTVSRITPENVRSNLNKYVKKFIFNELLVRLALKKKIQQEEGFRRDVGIWAEGFLSSYLMNKFLDSVKVSSNEIRKYYNGIKGLIPDSVKSKTQFIFGKLRRMLYLKKLKYLYNQKTLEFAKKYGFKINRKALKAVKVTSVEMITYRYLGFGNTITAVPFIQPIYEWKFWLPKPIKKVKEY